MQKWVSGDELVLDIADYSVTFLAGEYPLGSRMALVSISYWRDGAGDWLLS